MDQTPPGGSPRPTVGPNSGQFRVLGAQGSYYLITGLWPLIHMASFEAVTGPKVDDWLVRMVGLLASVTGATLVLAAYRGTTVLEIVALAAGTAAAFAGVDLWYVLSGRISAVYVADAAAEIGFIVLLIATGRTARRVGPQSGS